MYFYDYDKIIETLKNWGYNKGHFEEAIYILANNDKEYIYSAETRILNDFISYTLELTRKGREAYTEWCEKNGYVPSGNRFLEFTDEDNDSVRNTKAEWGLLD